MNRAEFERIEQNCLTPKQKQVLELLLQDKTNQEIAQAIKLNCPSGVSHHVRNIAQVFQIDDDYRDRLIELFIKYQRVRLDFRLIQKYQLLAPTDYYQVGGTLPSNASNYVLRASDRQLYEHLIRGDYCLVLNPRQTGKSSLRVRTAQKLKSEGIKCVGVDITLLGGNEQQEIRTKGFIGEVFSQLNLRLDLNHWWHQHQSLTLMQRLNSALDLMLTKVSGKVIIFIDEIDSIPNADDFFALLRGCYNQRAEKPAYNRLTFCLLGVASPQELMRNKQRTPFNIGVALKLLGFTVDEAQQALLPGLSLTTSNPKTTLSEILSWTKGQPFLTQRLCQLIIDHAGNTIVNVSEIVRQYIITNWQQQDTALHLQTICDRLIHNSLSPRMLELYGQIINGSKITFSGSEAEMQLLLSGLVTVSDGVLQVHNPIYQQIFNHQWLKLQIQHSLLA